MSLQVIEGGRESAVNTPHPSIHALEEMFERRWTLDDLCFAIDGTQETRLTLELFFLVGPSEPNMQMGKLCEELDKAFGVSLGFFAKLEAGWLAWVADGRDGAFAQLSIRCRKLEADLSSMRMMRDVGFEKLNEYIDNLKEAEKTEQELVRQVQSLRGRKLALGKALDDESAAHHATKLKLAEVTRRIVELHDAVCRPGQPTNHDFFGCALDGILALTSTTEPVL